MTLDDIRAFATANPEDFAEYLLADGWRWGNSEIAGYFDRMYATNLRDKFAIAALPACLDRDYGNDWGKSGSRHKVLAAHSAYAIADAMMAARKEPEA
jgi:hypothetical protein